MSVQVPEGAQVKFKHLRRIEENGQVFYLSRHEYEEQGKEPSPKGGQTVCILTMPNGNEYTETVTVHYKDNFSRRIGRDVALGRALKQTLARR